MPKQKLTNSLIFKIGFRVVLVEIIILASIGVFYINRFVNEVDQRLIENVKLPSQLIDGGLVRLVALNDPDSLRLLVGDNIQQVILATPDGQVIFSLDETYSQSNVADIPFLNEAWFSEQNSGSITDWGNIENTQFIFNVSRLRSASGNDTYLYVQSDTSSAEFQKQSIMILFFLGSLVTLIATSLIVSVFFQRVVFRRLNQTVTTLQNVEKGNLRSRIAHIESDDEISSLQHSVNKMIAQLQSLFSTLEQRVEDRTREAEEARKQAEKANHAKSIFLSNMSHELRTPLNTVIGYGTSMLTMPEMYEGKQLDSVFAKDVSTILTNGKYLLGLINDILDLSKIEAGKLTLDQQPVNLADTFSGVFSTITGLLQGKSIQLRPDYPDNLPDVWADSLRVRQILLNLMSNAVKYTESGSITLSAKVVGDKLTIAVADTGVGIPEELLESIFDRFVQAKTEHQFIGTGLGLDICQQLCRMHGSELNISSVVGQGTTFNFELPLATAEQLTAITQSANANQVGTISDDGILDPSSYYNILVVALSSGVRINLRKVFEAENHNVFESVNLEDGMSLAKGLLPDFIVVDIDQDKAGIDIVHALRDDEETRSITLVVLSPFKELAELEPLHIDVYLKKPIHGKRVLETVNRLLHPKNSDKESIKETL
jgi:signal transduction histidine kinase/ActR/RegA family two-component response regulator